MGTQETGGQRAMDLRYFIQSCHGKPLQGFTQGRTVWFESKNLYLVERCERDKEMVELLGGGGTDGQGSPQRP